jgi:hypothetical protein
MKDFEDEIEVLESVLSNIEAAIGDVQDSPYHSYLAQSWELDKEEIQSRLDELYAIQDEQFAREMKELNLQYEEVRL